MRLSKLSNVANNIAAQFRSIRVCAGNDPATLTLRQIELSILNELACKIGIELALAGLTKHAANFEQACMSSPGIRQVVSVTASPVGEAATKARMEAHFFN